MTAILALDVTEIMHPLHNYANGADYAKWCILGDKIMQQIMQYGAF